jgi:hypothetical protein
MSAKAGVGCGAAAAASGARNRSAMTMTISRTKRYRSAVVQFTLEPPSHANLIRGYSGSELLIGQQRLTRSCIVTAEQLISEWEPDTFAELAPAHLEAIFALAPE